MLMASFAVGRAQQLIYLLQVLKRDDRIPDLPIYLDSPMACDATSIYRHHREDHDLSEGELDDANPVLAGPIGPSLPLRRRIEGPQPRDRPGRDHLRSGMMDAGRIVHHLKYRLPNAIEHDRARRLHGRRHPRPTAAKRRQVPADARPGSAGPGRDRKNPRPQRPRRPQRPVALARTARARRSKHSSSTASPSSAEALAATLRDERGWNVTIPDLGESHELT